MGKEFANLLTSHYFRMTLVVKKNVLFYPIRVTFFGSDAVMLIADNIAQLVQKFRFLHKILHIPEYYIAQTPKVDIRTPAI